MPNSSEALRRRMLIGYLVILVTLYGLAFASSPNALSRGELAATTVSLVGLGLALPRGLHGWRYTVVASSMCAAPLVALPFHVLLVAQVWALIPLMFAAIFLRTWHRASVARASAVLVAAGAAAALLIAPAEIPPLWTVLYGVCIIGAPEIFGLLNASIVEAALRDPLTSVWNRAGVDREAGALVGRARRRRESIAVIVLDVDHFKSINDRYGHAVGDRVLGDLAQRWTEQLPDSAVIGRMGGDEFVVVACGYDDERARALADTLGNEQEVGVTTGVAVGRPADDDAMLADLITAADEDLYRRKRNRSDTATPILDGETEPRSA